MTASVPSGARQVQNHVVPALDFKALGGAISRSLKLRFHCARVVARIATYYEGITDSSRSTATTTSNILVLTRLSGCLPADNESQLASPCWVGSDLFFVRGPDWALTNYAYSNDQNG